MLESTDSLRWWVLLQVNDVWFIDIAEPVPRHTAYREILPNSATFLILESNGNVLLSFSIAPFLQWPPAELSAWLSFQVGMIAISISFETRCLTCIQNSLHIVFTSLMSNVPFSQQQRLHPPAPCCRVPTGRCLHIPAWAYQSRRFVQSLTTTPDIPIHHVISWWAGHDCIAWNHHSAYYRVHHHPRIGFTDSDFETFEINLAQRALVHARIISQTIGFLIVGEMFDRSPHSVALQAVHPWGGNLTGEHWVFGEIFEIASTREGLRWIFIPGPNRTSAPYSCTSLPMAVPTSFTKRCSMTTTGKCLGETRAVISFRSVLARGRYAQTCRSVAQHGTRDAQPCDFGCFTCRTRDQNLSLGSGELANRNRVCWKCNPSSCAFSSSVICLTTASIFFAVSLVCAAAFVDNQMWRVRSINCWCLLF